jgi:hypothetical protein
MGVFHSATQAEGTPQELAADLAFHIATLLATLSLILTWLTSISQPLPLMLACWCILLGLWRPQLFVHLSTAWYSMLNVGTRILLSFYWFFYILPSGLYMQLRGLDPLHRQFDATSTTYWQAPQPATDMRKLG